MYKKTLHWSYLNFKAIPMDLFLYEDLEEVYLKENFITTIPHWLLNLTCLRFIHLAGNELTHLPEDLYLLENLEFLDVSLNALEELPDTLGLVISLQRLNVSGNKIKAIPKSIGNLKKLEELNISKNVLTSLPVHISECSRLNELNFSDNTDIWYIPDRISFMPSLQSISADRCSLIYLPVALSKFINNVRIFHNTSLTHIPMCYEKFYRSFYENRQKPTPINIPSENLFWVIEKETNTKLLLPIGTRQIFPVPSLECQVPLYDHCIRALQYYNRQIALYENRALYNYLPERPMTNHIRNGPIGRCTVANCANPLFTSFYFMVVKRRNSTSKQIFTCYFCSHFCANFWLQENSKKYYQLEWEPCDEL